MEGYLSTGFGSFLTANRVYFIKTLYRYLALEACILQCSVCFSLATPATPGIHRKTRAFSVEKKVDSDNKKYKMNRPFNNFMNILSIRIVRYLYSILQVDT